MTQLQAACLQFSVAAGDMDTNRRRVAAAMATVTVNGAAGLVVLPELWATGFAYPRLAELARQTPANLAFLQQLAAEHGVLIAGSLPEQEGDCYFNTLFVVGATGELGSYRKQQLFAPMGERDHFTPGSSPRPMATDIGRLAGLVCYDLRFPELAGSQAAAGADLLVVSAQWPASRLSHWRTLVQARAVENQLYCVACNRCGISGGTLFGGHSMIVGPDGRILAEAGEQAQVIGAPLDLDRQREIRRRFCTVGRTPWRHADSDKVLSLAAGAALVATNRAMGRSTVFTNGCFDLLHAGHVSYLEEARRRGDCLIVGLNSDRSIRAIKGPDRPVNNEQDRARVLAALGCVDAVILFAEETPARLIQTLLPDVLVKGADWAQENIVGATEVLAAGGRVETIPLVADRSTTAVIDRIRGTGPKQMNDGQA